MSVKHLGVAQKADDKKYVRVTKCTKLELPLENFVKLGEHTNCPDCIRENIQHCADLAIYH